MESNTNPKDAKSKSNPPKKRKPTSKVGKRYFVGATYIKGYGTVAPGEELTKEMIDAWNKATNVSIDRFVASKED